MRRLRNTGLLLCLAALGAAAGGCAIADTGAFPRLQEEVVALKREVAAMKASQASAAPAAAPAGRVESPDMSAVEKNVADLSAGSDQMRADLLAATTRADEAKVQTQKEIAQLNDRAAEQSQALAEMKTRVGRIEDLDRRIAALEEKVGKIEGALHAPASASAPAPVPQDWKSPEEMYDYALGLIKAGENRKGREVFSSFASKYPDHKLMQNVFYWKGESFYAEKDYENAILSFQDVVDRYPNGDKAPDAMYKQGLSFLALKDRKNARIVLELLVSKHPKSAAADKARQKLGEIK